MRSTSFLAVALTILSLAKLVSALTLKKVATTNCYAISLISGSVLPTRCHDSDNSSITCRVYHPRYNNRNTYLGYIHRAEPVTFSGSHGRSPRFSLYGKTDNVDDVIKVLYDSLKSKKTTFVDLRNRLSDAGISLDGCQKPDDVIRRVAQLEVLGKDRLEDEIRKSDPKFQAILNEIHSENLSTYKSKSGNARSDYIASLRSKLISKNVEFDKKATDEEIIRLASEVESCDRVGFQLPSTKPVNDGSQRIESYKDEADSIFAVYRKIEDEHIRDKFISQIKEELSERSIDYKDCKKNEDLINRLAYGRVFPQEKKHKAATPKQFNVEPQFAKPWDTALMDRNDPFKSMFDLGNMQGLFDISGGMFDNGQEMPDMFEDDGGPNAGLSMLKDIAKMFGVDFGAGEKEKIVFENQETPTNYQPEESTEDNSVEDEEQIQDDELKSIFAKAKETNDRVLTRILTKCVKDKKMCDALKYANTNGYEVAKGKYGNDKSVLYILEKLYERGVFE